MTREGIKEYLMQINEAPEPINRWKPDILCELIDQIYDDFEEATSILLKANEEEIHRHFMECEKFKEQLDMEKRKAYLDGSNDCFKALKEVGKLK